MFFQGSIDFLLNLKIHQQEIFLANVVKLVNDIRHGDV